jgi:hypothetical protein
MNIKINDVFINYKNDKHTVIKISKTGLNIQCLNQNNKIVKFRYFEKTGKYISGNNLEL